MERESAAAATARSTSDTATTQPQTSAVPTSTYNTQRVYRYDTEPALRPTYIPLQYRYRSRDYLIIYDNSYRGYGWYDPAGSWTYYDSVASIPPTSITTQPVVSTPSYYHQYSRPPRNNVFSGLMRIILMVCAALLLFYLFTLLLRRMAKSINRAAGSTTSVQPPPQPYSPAAPAKENTFIDRMTNRDDITGVAKGDIVTLSDALSLKDAREIDSNAEGLKVTVDSVLRVREKNGLATWTFIYGTSEKDDQSLLIKVKTVDDNREFACYTLEREGTRQDFLDENYFWLFSKPETEEFSPLDLRYTNQFKQDLAGVGVDDLYKMIHRSELHGTGTYSPVRTGINEVLTTVAEYHTDAVREGTEYLVLETGNGGSSQLETWWGAPLKTSEIKT